MRSEQQKTENTQKDNESIFTDDLKNFTGGCLCGAVRFESINPPYNTGYCHCGMCRKSLGNLFGTFVIVKRRDLRYLTREPDWYQSSDTVRRGFCGKCGSPILYQRVEKDFDAVWIGTFDEPEDYIPSAHWSNDNKISWVDIHAHLPTHS
jgi:hypothetical protein